jgi:hypothetical protein
LETEAVKTGVREIAGRRPKFYKRFQKDKTLWRKRGKRPGNGI